MSSGEGAGDNNCILWLLFLLLEISRNVVAAPAVAANFSLILVVVEVPKKDTKAKKKRRTVVFILKYFDF
ncbi:unnamed protein product [Bathycoccus prasinos]